MVASLGAFLARPSVAQQQEKTGTTSKANSQSIDELLLFFPSKYPSGDWTPSDLRFVGAMDEARVRQRLKEHFRMLWPRE